jgi:hypothetical protein
MQNQFPERKKNLKIDKIKICLEIICDDFNIDNTHSAKFAFILATTPAKLSTKFNNPPKLITSDNKFQRYYFHLE